ncbi:hypothetical protein KY284_017488 [Solanum tuberosum]|nr:hypothetical protein KY284_017488 [Solanum tuberosum]
MASSSVNSIVETHFIIFISAILMEIGEAEEGLHPSSETMRKYNPKIEYPIQSPGNSGYLRDIAMDSLEKFGVGVIYPRRIFEFYNDLHSYLASSGVDGVNVQTLLETLGFGHGSHVALTGRYQEASLLRETLEQTTSFAVVGESGLFTPADIGYVQEADVKPVLVGESIVKQEDPTKGITELFGKDISC